MVINPKIATDEIDRLIIDIDWEICQSITDEEADKLADWSDRLRDIKKLIRRKKEEICELKLTHIQKF